MRLMLLSNTANRGQEPLQHARSVLEAHLEGVREVLFIPWALHDLDAYTAQAAAALRPFGIRVRGIHTAGEPATAIREAAALWVGGGNTFRLLRRLRRSGAIPAIREAVAQGTPYLGASAGTNVAGPTIGTTNDMPIVDPGGFDALGLVPVQLNPHYVDADPTRTHNGETRALRLEQYLEEQPGPVLALREGTWIRVSGIGHSVKQIVLGGQAVGVTAPGPARLFSRTCQRELSAGDISPLVLSTARLSDGQ